MSMSIGTALGPTISLPASPTTTGDTMDPVQAVVLQKALVESATSQLALIRSLETTGGLGQNVNVHA